MDSPDALGLDSRRWQLALDLADDWCRRDLIPSIGLVVGRSDRTNGVRLSGRHRLESASPPVREDAIFLIASITKPIVATGILLLVERGRLPLGDRVVDLIPEFGKNAKFGITIRHLLTHTSGLPDMLPNNRRLRAAQAPLSTFVEEICQIRPDFPPGRGVQYQSTGFAILGVGLHVIHLTSSAAAYLIGLLPHGKRAG